MKYKILVVDNEIETILSTKSVLEIWGYEVESAKSGIEAIEKVRGAKTEFAVALIDFRMPEMNGVETGVAIRSANKEISIVIYSADVESSDPVYETMKSKIGDFVRLRKNSNTDTLEKALKDACSRFEEHRTLKPDEQKKEAREFLAKFNLIGQSNGMVEVGKWIIVGQKTDKHMLILGESGVGKELVARGIHNNSPKPFLALNCGTLRNLDLLASELFGHEKGAFTGAIGRKIGIFEAAQGGTVFLDEIDRMPLHAQNYLLRVLQEKKVKRVGSSGEEYPVNFRLIAAAKPGIENLVKKELFQADLYYRLKHLVVKIPPLRERREDIKLLIDHFKKLENTKTNQKKEFLMQTVHALENHVWEGNVRELQNLVESLMLRSTTDKIGPSLLGPEFKRINIVASNSAVSLKEYDRKVQEQRRDYVTALVQTAGSLRQAATWLEVGPSTVSYIVNPPEKKLDLEPLNEDEQD
jgi:DNA-binding NtrC family response regulator